MATPNEASCGRVTVWTVLHIRVPSCNGLLTAAVVRMVEVTGSNLSAARGLCMSGLRYCSYIRAFMLVPAYLCVWMNKSDTTVVSRFTVLLLKQINVWQQLMAAKGTIALVGIIAASTFSAFSVKSSFFNVSEVLFVYNTESMARSSVWTVAINGIRQHVFFFLRNFKRCFAISCVCVSVCVFACLSSCLSYVFSVHPSFHPPIYPSTYEYKSIDP